MKHRLIFLMCMILALVMCCGVVLASDGESGTLYTMPNIFPIDPEAELIECEHKFGDLRMIETSPVELDEYYYCYMDISINAKTCEKCGVTAYELDYELFPHEGNETICKRCGKPLIPPMNILPLEEQ